MGPAFELPPAGDPRDISGGLYLPLEQNARCSSCCRPKYRKSLVFGRVTARRMLVLLEGIIPSFSSSPLRTLPGRCDDADG